jgi:hypothetical protein
MIRRTLRQTQSATFAIVLPDNDERLQPFGTGFFASPDGWFVTARHVLERDDGNMRDDLDELRLIKEIRNPPPQFLDKAHLDYENSDADLALLKFDFSDHASKAFLERRTTFPHLEVSRRTLEEGEPVYSFGYPLSDFAWTAQPGVEVGESRLSPRTTSAIIASTVEFTQSLTIHGAAPGDYVLDKALNYGNSGGPIIASETGAVHAACTRFQPVDIPQEDDTFVWIPSLYGVATSLARPDLLSEMDARGISISTV